MKRVKDNCKNLLEKYHNLSMPLKASIWFLVCSVIQKCFSMISTPIFTRIMSTSQYGQVANYYSWYDILYPFFTLYITGVAYNNVLVKYEKERNKATLSLMLLTSLITCVFSIIYVFFRKFFNELMGISTGMMFVMIAEILFVPIIDFWSAKERYDYKYKKLIAVTLGSTLLSLIVGMISVCLVDNKYEARIISKVIFTVIIGLLIYKLSYLSAKGKVTTKYWGYALRLSIPLIPHYLSMKILNQADRVMITNMVGSSKTGIYSLAYTVAMLMIVVTDAINRSMCPYIYKAINSKNIKPVRQIVNGVVTLVLVFTFLEMLIAPELIRIFATEEYMEAVGVIPPLAMSVYLTFVYVIYSNVEFYYEKTGFATLTSVIIAIINIGLNYFFIKKIGYWAAGYTTVICYILFVLAHYFNYTRVCKKHSELFEIYDSKYIFLITIFGLLMMILCSMIYQYTVIRMTLILLIFICMYLFRSKIYSLVYLKDEVK